MQPRLPFITVFGLGHMRPASGTWGSLPPAAIALVLWMLGLAPREGPHAPAPLDVLAPHGEAASALASIAYVLTLALVLVVFSLACVLQGDRAEARFGHDPAEVVADETAGQCVPLLGLALVPACFDSFWSSVLWIGASFLAFRLLDILKPWPANALQRIAGGWGILLDDLAAALYSLAIVTTAAWWWA